MRNKEKGLLMHSFELKREAEFALGALEKFSGFMDGVRSISNALADLPVHLGQLSTVGENRLGVVRGEIKSSISNIRSIIGSLSTRQIFKDIEGLSSLLEELGDGELDDLGLLEKTNSKLQKFSSDYEGYIDNYRIENAVPLLFSSGRLVYSLESLIGAYRFSAINLSGSDCIEDDGSRSQLSLYLSNIKDLRDFAEKLNAISGLYEDIAGLLGVDLTDYPLVIDQVEAGSLWSKVFGESRVIGLMVDVLKGSAGFVYRNYTAEGKIASIPGKLESLDKIIDLTGRLEQAGVDTGEIKDEVRRATVGIAKSLNELLDHQYKVEINGESLSVADEVLKGLTGDSWRRPRLAYEDKEDPPLSLPPPE